MNQNSTIGVCASPQKNISCAVGGTPQLPQVPTALGELTQQMENLDRLISLLMDRLHPVTEPTPLEGSALSASNLVPLADAINTQALHAQHMSGRLKGLLAGLQL
jgi:hypothetical protein